MFLDDYHRVISEASDPRRLYFCKYLDFAFTAIQCDVVILYVICNNWMRRAYGQIPLTEINYEGDVSM